LGEVFNIIGAVGTAEVELAPYPGGSAKTPTGRVRKIYVMVFTNTTATAITLTLKIYLDNSLEASFNIVVSASSSVSLIGDVDSPILLIPSDRTLKAVASAGSVDVLMAGFDE